MCNDFRLRAPIYCRNLRFSSTASRTRRARVPLRFRSLGTEWRSSAARAVRDPQGDARLGACRRRNIQLQQVIGSHLDVATFVIAAIAVSDRPAELEPAKAIASIPMARIEPRIAFVLSHLLNSRCSFGDIF